MSHSRRDQSHEPLQLIQVKNPLSPLPAHNGWNAALDGFDWDAVERNFNFVTMGRVVSGDAGFYMQPLPLAQLGYRPHPLATELHDQLWALHRFIQVTKGRMLSEQEARTMRERKEQIRQHQRQIWAATFAPKPAPKLQAKQLSLL